MNKTQKCLESRDKIQAQFRVDKLEAYESGVLLLAKLNMVKSNNSFARHGKSRDRLAVGSAGCFGRK